MKNIQTRKTMHGFGSKHNCSLNPNPFRVPFSKEEAFVSMIRSDGTHTYVNHPLRGQSMVSLPRTALKNKLKAIFL